MSQNLLSLDGVTKSHDGRPLIVDATMGIDAGNKIGIIGANGAGKSTLLNIIAGRLDADAGRVIMRKNTRMAFLEQVPTLDPTVTVRDALEDGLVELRRAIEAYQRAATNMQAESAPLLEKIEQLGGWDYQHRIDEVAAQLNVPNLNAEIGHLSGGEKRRVALAQVVLQQPELLLVDEPTNHLDTNTVDWLEQWLIESKAAVILVTHDRYFLDDVVEHLWELREGTLKSYAGNYTDYLAARAIEMAHSERTQHRQLRILMTELEWARRSPSARSTKQQARLERLDKAQEELSKRGGETFVNEFRFGKPPRLGGRILEFADVHMSYAERSLIDGLTLEMCRGERIGIIGPNGCGKSTLLELILGNQKPTTGHITIGKNTRMAYFDQQRALLDPQATVREIVAPDGADVVAPGGGAATVVVQAWLDRFGFPVPTHGRTVDSLSGGERNRLAIARFLLEEANLLLLDEPTNDLDIPTLNILEDALIHFPGCVLVVTHDRYFLDKVCTGIIAFEYEYLEPGTVTFVQGNYSHYAGVRLKELKERAATDTKDRARAQRQQRASERNEPHGRNEKTSGKPESKKKGLTYGERIELEKLEPTIEECDAMIRNLERELTARDIWRDDPGKARTIHDELETTRKRSAELFARWEELMTRREQLN